MHVNLLIRPGLRPKSDVLERAIHLLRQVSDISHDDIEIYRGFEVRLLRLNIVDVLEECLCGVVIVLEALEGPFRVQVDCQVGPPHILESVKGAGDVLPSRCVKRIDACVHELMAIIEAKRRTLQLVLREINYHLGLVLFIHLEQITERLSWLLQFGPA